MKRILCLLITVVLSMSLLCSVPVYATNMNINRITYLSLAYEYIERDINSGLPFCKWNDESTITDVTPLYSPDGEKIGYDLDISTDGEPSGYVRIISANGEPRAVYSCYGGQSPSIAYANSEDISIDNKVYLVDILTLAIKTNYGFKVIGWEYPISEVQLSESYKYTMGLLSKSGEVWQDDGSAFSINSVLPDADDYSYCIWDDFKTLYITDGAGHHRLMDNSCTPIAATNVLRYFRSTGASSMPNKYTNSQIFSVLYYDMDTNNNSVGGFDNPGTPVDNILSGLKTSCTELAAGTPTTAVKGSKVHTALSSSTVKSYIDDGYMLIASVIDYKNNGAHSLVIYGYDSSNYYIVDGLSRSIDRISISNLEVYHFVAVKF